MRTPIRATEPEIIAARLNLSQAVEDIAAEIEAEFGFGWRGSATAPTSLAELTAEFRCAQITGLPVRVSSKYCESTIYSSPKVNQAFRFVHDSRHCFLQADFDTESELLVASCHLARLRHLGFDGDTVEFRLLYADTVGQTLFLAETGTFVVDQLRFALRCLEGPLEVAIKAEALAQLGRAS